MTMALAFAVGVASTAQEPVSVSADNSQLLYTTILGFLSLLATQGVQLWRERREERKREQQREWDLQDRAVAREEVRRNSEAQRFETIATAVELARATKIHSAEIKSQLAENTALTHRVGQKADAAYEVGNNFAGRLDEYDKNTTAQMQALRDELFGKKGQIDHIEAVSEDTNVKVTEIQEGSEKAGKP